MTSACSCARLGLRTLRFGLALLAGAAHGQYYYSDSFASYNSSAWTRNDINTELTFGGSGLGVDPGGWFGTTKNLIANNNGGNIGRHEIKATVNGFTGGSYMDLWLGASTAGNSGYKLSFSSGALSVYSVTFGSSSLIAWHSFSSSGTTTIRAILAPAGIRVVIGSQILWTPTSSGFGGSQGIGFTGLPMGVNFTQAELAAGDVTAPNNVTGLSGLGSPGQVNLTWTGASDNAGGSGLLRYNVYRNGVLAASTNNTYYTDSAVSPGTNYTYTVKSEDYHTNESSGANVVVQTGTSFQISDPTLPRRTGVRALGSYWGAAGENIDTRSGNLNFSVPLLKAQGRHGASLALGLTYNSQNWRRKSGVVYQIGYDSGYGFGWHLQAGSIFAVYSSPGVISHYVFSDSTGAEYRLDVNDGGIWWGKEGLYVAYDPGNARVRFTDGTFWDMGSMAAVTEPDAGLRYPRRVTDSNGNYISLEYQPGYGQGSANSSSRLSWIKDIRSAPGNAYTFSYTTYSGELLPHLTGIATTLPTGENYSLTYSLVGLQEPFAGAAKGNARMLQSFSTTALPLTHTFEYGTNNAGELTKVIFPYKGELQWTYSAFAYPDTQELREVSRRKLVKQLGATATTYTLVYGSGASQVHATGVVRDPNGVSEKYWEFETNTGASSYGLVTKQREQVQGTGAVKREAAFTWNTDARGNRYIGTSITTLDPGQAYQKQVKNEQSISVEGNLMWSKAYDFANALRSTHTFTYQTGSAYTQRFILNRQTAMTITNGAGTYMGGTAATYDSYPGGALTPRSGLDLHDTANYGQFMTTRGNPTAGGVSGGYSSSSTYDITGFATGSTNGTTTTAATPDAKNVVATIMTPNSNLLLAMTTGFNSIYQITSVTGPNGATTSVGYDANARPSSTTGPNGAYTTFSYDDSNRTKTATTGSRWVKTYLDGFGRTIKEESGYSSTIVSAVNTEYDSCGCSPLGKVKRVSRPYTGATPAYWTTYTYDSQGRVLTVNQGVPHAGGSPAGTTTYLYEGNTTTVTSPANKWKKHEVDVAGNLIKVTEPNPAGGTFVTDYLYNEKNQLTTVTMVRPTGTQTRTFTYDANGKVLTATNPETGTVTNTYDSSTGLLQTRVDAKNQKTTYTYDNYKRVTEIKRYIWEQPFGFPLAYYERPDQATKFYYDSNPDGSFGATNLAGRLAYVETSSKRGGAAWNAPGGGTAWETMTFREMYSYKTSGLMEKKRLLAIGRYSPAHSVASDYLESSYTYDTEGRMTGQTYPAAHDLLGTTEVAGTSYAYGFDSMGRPNTMTGYIDGVTYNAAGQPTAITTSNPQVNVETRVYNALGQLTSLTSGALRFEYDFSATQNDGRITTQRTFSSGTQIESIGYLYDSLNRLSSATAAGQWSASYGYDGFGNLLSVTPTGSGPSSMSVTVGATTNRVTGWTYDANGNVEAMPGFTGKYDIENRLKEATKNSTILYGYGADNRRIYESKRTVVNSGGDTIDEYVTFWSGQRIGKYKVRWNSEAPNFGAPNSFVFAKVEENLYFGSKPLKVNGGVNMSADRRGSIRSGKDYFPYGQENPTTTAGDKEKYATYKHDAATDLSYADQRYYATGTGRFMTGDPIICPIRAAGKASHPSSYNRYSYVENDPINYIDPDGLCMQPDEKSPLDSPNYEQGSGGSLTQRSPEGTGGWETEDGRFANVRLLQALAAAAIRAAAEEGAAQRYVAYLELTSDCITMKNRKTGRPSRDRTYQAIDQYGNPVAATITERVYDTGGNLVDVQDPLSVSGTGVFSDQVGLGAFESGARTQYQYFVTSIGGTAWQNVPTPVRINQTVPTTGQGTFMVFSMVVSGSTSISGTLHNDVSYNGDPGMWNSDGSPRLPLCDR